MSSGLSAAVHFSLANHQLATITRLLDSVNGHALTSVPKSKSDHLLSKINLKTPKKMKAHFSSICCAAEQRKQEIVWIHRSDFNETAELSLKMPAMPK